MREKKRAGTAVVTEGAAHAALRRGPAVELAAEEERLLRMRVGAPLPSNGKLERLATATDADIDLLAMEIEAYLRMGRKSQKTATPPSRTVIPIPSRAKEKIVRALRKKS